jgi:hypothetical protein
MDDRFPALLVPCSENEVEVPLWDFVCLFGQFEPFHAGIFCVNKLMNAVRRVFPFELEFELEQLIKNVFQVFIWIIVKGTVRGIDECFVFLCF